MVWLSYLLNILIITALIGIIMLQKGSEGLFSSSKAFGIRGRSNTIIKITYILGAAFLLNSLILGILFKRQHKVEMITSAEIVESKKPDKAKQ